MISVGNLVAGGTGKTVVVDYLVKALADHGHGAVVCRGYRAGDDGLNDEMRLLKRHFPDLICEANPLRKIALEKSQEQGAKWAVMDDGFQHRKVNRDLNLVLLDATDPFTKGLLPYGLRREPISALHRADMIVLSHADCVEPNDLKQLKRQLTERFGKPIVAGKHVLQPPANQGGEICPEGPIHMLAGIGTPRHFQEALTRMGYRIEKSTLPGDHRAPNDSELKKLEASSIPVVCTEKDIVKQSVARPWYVAGVKWQFLEGEEELAQALKKVMENYA